MTDGDTATETATAAHHDAEPAQDKQLDEAFDRIVREGRPRLYRSWPALLSTAVVAGIEVGFGVLALLAVDHATHSPLLGGIAFSVGFLALQLGHSELFTEGFLVPVTVVAAREARPRHLAKFWAGTLVGNLAGGWLMTWFVVTAFPQLRSTARELGASYVNAGFDARTFCLALLAGAGITLMTRMHNGTDDEVAKAIASVAAAFVIAGVGLHHSVLDSLLAFSGLHAGADYGYLQWLAWFGWAVFGNVVGGLGLTTVLRLVRSKARLQEARRSGPSAERATGDAQQAETVRETAAG